MFMGAHAKKKVMHFPFGRIARFFFNSLVFWQLQRYSIFLAVPSLGVTWGLSLLFVLVL